MENKHCSQEEIFDYAKTRLLKLITSYNFIPEKYGCTKSIGRGKICEIIETIEHLTPYRIYLSYDNFNQNKIGKCIYTKPSVDVILYEKRSE